MDFKKVIRDLAKKRGISLQQLSFSMGEIQQILAQQMGNQDMKLSRFEQILSYLGYGLEIVELPAVRISADYADQVIFNKVPGCYWFVDPKTERYVGCVISESVNCVSFASKEACFEWLKNFAG